MLQHLFVSPHFDDAIGSCGGTIARLVSIGHAVRVSTAFGGVESEPLSMPARVLHDEWKLDRPVSQRRSEDASACQVLGCESSFLEFRDAIYRQDADGRHLYPTFESLRTSIALEDRLLAERLAAELGAFAHTNTVFYCPLGIGAHVDHILARDCGRILQARDFTVVFYREFYYDRQWSGGEIDDQDMARVNVTLTRDECSRKVTAFSEYRSQISDLFETDAGMTSYFEEIGKEESFFFPRRADASLLTLLRSALTREPSRS